MFSNIGLHITAVLLRLSADATESKTSTAHGYDLSSGLHHYGLQALQLAVTIEALAPHSASTCAERQRSSLDLQAKTLAHLGR